MRHGTYLDSGRHLDLILPALQGTLMRKSKNRLLEAQPGSVNTGSPTMVRHPSRHMVHFLYVRSQTSSVRYRSASLHMVCRRPTDDITTQYNLIFDVVCAAAHTGLCGRPRLSAVAPSTDVLHASPASASMGPRACVTHQGCIRFSAPHEAI